MAHARTHTTGCQASPPTQLHVDLLIRALGCLGGRPTCVLVRPGPCPAFWLRIDGNPGQRDLPLDVLDAACLLLSRRVAVELVEDPAADWDEALRRLVDDLRRRRRVRRPAPREGVSLRSSIGS